MLKEQIEKMLKSEYKVEVTEDPQANWHFVGQTLSLPTLDVINPINSDKVVVAHGWQVPEYWQKMLGGDEARSPVPGLQKALAVMGSGGLAYKIHKGPPMVFELHRVLYCTGLEKMGIPVFGELAPPSMQELMDAIQAVSSARAVVILSFIEAYGEVPE